MPGFVMYKSALAHFPYGQSATFHCHHKRDYEDCKQILKLSLKLTHTLERPERQWPLPKDRQRPQTFLFGQSGILQAVFVWLTIQPKPASRMFFLKRLRLRGSHPPGQIRPRWLRHLVRAGLSQQLRCCFRRCCSSAW